MTCSVLNKRGVQVKEFNLDPYNYNKMKKKEIAYRGRLIPIVSYGWQECDNMSYRIVDTPEGEIFFVGGHAVI